MAGSAGLRMCTSVTVPCAETHILTTAETFISARASDGGSFTRYSSALGSMSSWPRAMRPETMRAGAGGAGGGGAVAAFGGGVSAVVSDAGTALGRALSVSPAGGAGTGGGGAIVGATADELLLSMLPALRETAAAVMGLAPGRAARRGR